MARASLLQQVRHNIIGTPTGQGELRQDGSVRPVPRRNGGTMSADHQISGVMDHAIAVRNISEAAAQWQRSQLPSVVPMWDEIELAGWSSDGEELTRSFHDWIPVRGGGVLLAAGRITESAVRNAQLAALLCESLRTALRAHVMHTDEVGTIISLISRTMAASGRGEPFADLALAIVQPVGGRVSLASAGKCVVMAVRALHCRFACTAKEALGECHEIEYATAGLTLRPRERLVLLVGPTTPETRKSIARHFAGLTAEAHRHMTATETIGHIRSGCQPAAAESSTSVVVVRRR